MSICEISIIILICQKLGSVRPVQHKKNVACAVLKMYEILRS